MLFVFDRPERYCFWMKDMKFHLDILWLDNSKRIVSIERNMSPRSYPETACPQEAARYVFEVNAGLSRQAGVDVGDRLAF
jgi:uncharacterized membrane protein (UPF0127 family)